MHIALNTNNATDLDLFSVAETILLHNHVVQYTCMYVCMYVCTCMYVCMYLHVHVYVCIHNLCLYMYVWHVFRCIMYTYMYNTLCNML